MSTIEDDIAYIQQLAGKPNEISADHGPSGRILTPFDESFLKTVRANPVRTHQLQVLRQSLVDNCRIYEKFKTEEITKIVQILEIGTICFVDIEMENVGLHGGTWIDKCFMTQDFKERYVSRMVYLSMLFDTEASSKETDSTAVIRILNDVILITDLASMSHVEIEPTRYKREFIDNSSKMTTTTMYCCGKCNKRECFTYSHTTRSADEGKTIRVVCKVCGNSWNS